MLIGVIRVGVFTATVAVLASSAELCAQQPAAQPPAPNAVADDGGGTYTLRSNAREVNLDIVVLDGKGRPVRGLPRNGFDVFEDGRPQTVLNFTERDATSEAASHPPPKLPPNTFTNFTPAGNPTASFVLLFDRLDTRFEDQVYASQMAEAFLRRLPPGTQVAIFDLNQRINMIQGFTTDRDLLIAAVKSKRAGPKISPMLDGPLEIHREDLLEDGLTVLGRYLAGFPGRKNLLWLTADIPGSRRQGAVVSPDNGLRGAEVAGTDTIDRAAIGDPGIEMANQLLAGLDRPGEDEAYMNGIMSLGKVAVYPMDVRGLMSPPKLAANPHHLEQWAAMDEMAQATGGEAIYSQNGLDGIMKEIVAQGSEFYSLTYVPTNKNYNGRYRNLKVRLNAQVLGIPGGTSGIHLQYRAGYVALDPEKVAAAAGSGAASSDFKLDSEGLPGEQGVTLHRLPKETLQASMTLGQLPPTELVFAASIKPDEGMFRLAKGSFLPDGDFMRDKFKYDTYREFEVSFATDAHSLRLSQGADGRHLGNIEFVAVVYNAQGEVANSFITRLALDLREPTYQQMLRTGLGAKHKIAIPVKGEYVIRLGIHEVETDRVGTMEIPVNMLKSAR